MKQEEKDQSLKALTDMRKVVEDALQNLRDALVSLEGLASGNYQYKEQHELRIIEFEDGLRRLDELTEEVRNLPVTE